MSSGAPVTYAADADGVGWITFDDPDSRANILNPASQVALADALARANADRVKAIVIVSTKERIFIAGADLKLLAALPDAATATSFSRQGQELFQRIANSATPVVCAIHGACAGGGFELALACHWRIASDAAVTRIGLPETGIGTIPGWGGCVRLPRLIGVKAALDHILKAQLLPADAALATGLVHEVVPEKELRTRAKAAALKLAMEGHPARPPAAAMPDGVITAARDAVLARTGGHQPALLAAIDAVEQTAGLEMTQALGIEARFFGEVTAGPVCKNLLHAYFLRETAKKRTLEAWFPPVRFQGDTAAMTARAEHASTRPVRRVGVIGAGVMGSGVAHWLAACGVDVVLRDVTPGLVERGMGVIRGLFDESVTRGKVTAGEATAALQRIATTTDWDGFDSCDVVIEAIVENAAAKRSLFADVARIVPAHAVLASNTSALPIEEIAGHVPQPERTLGIHFFNPVSRMPLVELILGSKTSSDAAARALDLVKMLRKSPVICRSSPGFLVTRVLFFYLNAAVRLWEEGGATTEIDASLRGFGWPMGPLRLIDEVGIDVTDFIFGELEHYFPTRFTRTASCGRLLAAGLKGRKNGASRGFYRYEAGEHVNEAESALLASRAPRAAARPHDIAGELMRVMVDEAQRSLDEGVVKSADDVDFALLSGAGFPAFRGGLLRWARTRP